jgi:hypothetical protein
MLAKGYRKRRFKFTTLFNYGGYVFQIQRPSENILSKHSKQSIRGGPPAWGVWQRANNGKLSDVIQAMKSD